jgi:hypothetical protein
MEYFIGIAWYIGAAIFSGVHAEKLGLSGWKYFSLAILFSPVIALIALSSETSKQKK